MDYEMRKLYSCFICTNLLDEATALKRCRHIFCWKCIHGKIVEHDWRCCPICCADFGPDPLMRLSHDDPLLLSREGENIPPADAENVEEDSDVDYSDESESSDEDDDDDYDTDSDMEDEQVGSEKSVPIETGKEAQVMEDANPTSGVVEENVQKLEAALMDHKIVDKDEEERAKLERQLALREEKARGKRPMGFEFPEVDSKKRFAQLVTPPSNRPSPEAKEQVGEEHTPRNQDMEKGGLDGSKPTSG
ncbi:probable E3 ubiquitin protein ligase DRIPH [Capsella rubella]|uniref:probable E3 ubiquitin protein ligase DRIPH n=1 Tax=Capsella rubella TaxID=81985 RepID=UPI000CD581F0|nr:probable E3 ubiquitin protein ligase DRIPH [Capsella rubella]